MEIPDFKTFEEFFEWIKGLDYEFVMENRAKLADYFDLQNWSLTEYSKLSGYIEKVRDWTFRSKFETLEDFNELKPFICFEEFLEWIKELDHAVISSNKVATDEYFTLRVWSDMERKRFEDYLKETPSRKKEHESKPEGSDTDISSNLQDTKEWYWNESAERIKRSFK